MVARGNGPMVLTNWPGEIAKADVLLTTWPRFVETGLADDWIRINATDPRFAPTGVPPKLRNAANAKLVRFLVR